jgi:hypothetical protein
MDFQYTTEVILYVIALSRLPDGTVLLFAPVLISQRTVANFRDYHARSFAIEQPRVTTLTILTESRSWKGRCAFERAPVE